MKKIISILLAIIMVTCSLFSLGITASANTLSTAQKVELNTSYSFQLDADDNYDYNFKFVPQQTGYYEFTLTADNSEAGENLKLELCTSDVTVIEEEYFNYATGNCSLVYELMAGEMYFIVATNYGNELINANLTATTHTHSYYTWDNCTASTSDNGWHSYECKKCEHYYSQTIYKIKSICISGTSFTYNGKTITPYITVKDSKGKTLTNGTDYTVTYASGRKNVGKYSVKVTFKGDYSGSKTFYFTINPKSTNLSKVTAGSKKLTVKWKKQTSQTTGYQIQYSTDKNFKKGNKTVNVAKNKTTSKTISKLKSKKKYYVRIRTYKTVKFNGKNTKIYSAWSKSKSVTTKK